MKKILTFLAAIAVVFSTAFVSVSPVSAAELTYTVDLTKYDEVEADAKKALKDAQAAEEAAEEALRTEMDKWESTKIEQNAAIQAAQDIIDSKLADIDGIQADIDVAEANFEEIVAFCEAEIENAEAKKVAANEAIAAAEADIAALEEKIEAEEENAAEYEMLINEANAKIEYYQAAMDKADTDIADYNTVLEQLQSEYEAVSIEVAAAKAKLENAVEAWEMWVPGLNEGIAEATFDKQECQDTIDALQAEIDANPGDAAIEANNKALINVENIKIAAIQDVLDRKQAALGEFNAARNAAQENYDNACDILDFASSNFLMINEYYENRISNSEVEKNAAYSAIVVAQDEIEILEHALEEGSITIEEYNAQIAEINAKIDFYNEYIADANDDIAKANTLLEDTHAGYEALVILLENTKAEYVEVEAEQKAVIADAYAKIDAADAALIAAAQALSDAQDAVVVAEDYLEGVIDGGKAHATDSAKADLADKSDAYKEGYNAGYDAVVLNYAELPAVDAEKDNTTTTTTTTNNPDASPSTGDVTNATTLIALLGVSLASAFIIVRRKRA